MAMTNINFERLYDVYFIPSILINMKTGYISLGKVTIDYQTLSVDVIVYRKCVDWVGTNNSFVLYTQIT